MTESSGIKYRVCSKSPGSEAYCRGRGSFTKDIAEAWVKGMDQRYPDIEHWIEPEGEHETRTPNVTRETILEGLIREGLEVMKDCQSSDYDWAHKQLDWIRKAEEACK